MSSVFEQKAPGIMRRLMGDFPALRLEDVAAIVGNLGHECGGFETLQEIKPTVAGSRGGYGWPQWTGSRRRAYEAYCKRTGKNPASDEANYAYLWIELSGHEGTEKAAIGKTVGAATLQSKVIAFEMAFLRAGVKHYTSRKKYAALALDAYRIAVRNGAVQPYPPAAPTSPPTPAKPKPNTVMDWLRGWFIQQATKQVVTTLKDTGMSSNLIHNLLNVAIALVAILSLPEVIALLPPELALAIVGLAATAKTIINVVRDGIGGLAKHQPPVE